MSLQSLTIDDVILFQALKDPDLRKDVSDRLIFRRYDKNEQIIDKDSPSSDIVFVLSGCVRIVIYSLSGKEVALDDVKSGGFFGELAAIDDSPRSANVMAVQDSVLAFLPAGVFKKILQQDPAVGMEVMRHLSWLLRQATGRIVDLSTLGANSRIQAELLRISSPKDEDDNAALISPIPIHSDIASRVSTTRETVARVMNDLVRQGVLERRKTEIEILDVERLEDLVQQSAEG